MLGSQPKRMTTLLSSLIARLRVRLYDSFDIEFFNCTMAGQTLDYDGFKLNTYP